jgi:2-aminoethylphosphonate-pyruvate transaminase
VRGDFLLLESGLIYDAAGLRVLINERRGNVVLASGPTNSGDEAHLEADADGRLLRQSKSRDDAASLADELTGVSRLTTAALEAMVSYWNARAADTPKMVYEAARGKPDARFCAEN